MSLRERQAQQVRVTVLEAVISALENTTADDLSMTSTINSDSGPRVATAELRILSEPDTSRAWWFLGTLAVLRNPEGRRARQR